MKILVTAFEPFGKNTFNISLEVLKQLPDVVDDSELVKCCLPVSFNNAPLVLAHNIRDYRPDVVLSLGQGGTMPEIHLERFAHNMMDCSQNDNDGNAHCEELIYENAPLAYRTPFAIKEIMEDCKEASLPVKVSNTAGLYVCNRVYYEALHLGQEALFVHINKEMDVEVATQCMMRIIKKLNKRKKV